MTWPRKLWWAFVALLVIVFLSLLGAKDAPAQGPRYQDPPLGRSVTSPAGWVGFACLTIEQIDELVEVYPLIARGGFISHDELPAGCHIVHNRISLTFLAVLESRPVAIDPPLVAHVYDATSRMISGQWFVMMLAPSDDDAPGGASQHGPRAQPISGLLP